MSPFSKLKKIKWWKISGLFILILVLSFLFAFSLYIKDIVKELNNSALPNLKSQKQYDAEGNGDNYWLGSANPKVTIVYFADFACPMCKSFFPKIREISTNYKKDVKIIFRDFPVISSYSMDLALAARCAGEQGFFWIMHDKLFINQGKIKTKEDIFNLAKQMSLDVGRFEYCFENKKYINQIKKDYEDGLKLEIKGTPTIFINGYKIEGDAPYDVLMRVIELLKNYK